MGKLSILITLSFIFIAQMQIREPYTFVVKAIQELRKTKKMGSTAENFNTCLFKMIFGDFDDLLGLHVINDFHLTYNQKWYQCKSMSFSREKEIYTRGIQRKLFFNENFDFTFWLIKNLSCIQNAFKLIFTHYNSFGQMSLIFQNEQNCKLAIQQTHHFYVCLRKCKPTNSWQKFNPLSSHKNFFHIKTILFFNQYGKKSKKKIKK